MALSPTPLGTGTINSNALTDFNAIVNLLNAAFPLAAANIASDAVETLKIKNGNVTAAKLATDAVETLKIKNANVTAEKLATDAVETLKIKDGNVTVGKLASDSVETLKIKNANVTLAKIANIAASTILGNNTANPAAPIALSVPDVNTLLGTALKVKVKQETRNMNAASGDITYSSYGFTPKTLIIFSFIGATTYQAMTIVGAAADDKFMSLSPGYSGWYGTDGVVHFFETSVKWQTSVFKEYNNDGFVLTWTRSATTPASQTITMLVLALA